MYVQAQAFGIMDWRKELFVFNVWLVTNGKFLNMCFFNSTKGWLESETFVCLSVFPARP